MTHRSDIPEVHFACLVGHVLYLRNIAQVSLSEGELAQNVKDTNWSPGFIQT